MLVYLLSLYAVNLTKKNFRTSKEKKIKIITNDKERITRFFILLFYNGQKTLQNFNTFRKRSISILRLWSQNMTV